MNSRGDRPAEFDIAEAVASLSASADAIEALTSAVTPAQAVWRPSPDRWSILEVINHLADEEVEDFRVRLDVILHEDDRPFPPIDPAGAVTERGYNERDLTESVGRFMQERGRSLGWLRSLEEADLERTRHHSELGPLTGRQMLASWVAHDLHHIRQLNALRYDRLASLVAPLSLAYAGNW